MGAAAGDVAGTAGDVAGGTALRGAEALRAIEAVGSSSGATTLEVRIQQCEATALR